MSYQRTRQDDGRTEQQVIVLREEGEQYQDHDIEEHETIIELTRTNLIIVTCPQEMDDASDGQNDQKGVCQVMGERYAVVGGEKGKLCEWQEMVGKWCEIVLMKKDDRCYPEPIGREQSQQGGDERAQAEAAEEDHQDPVKGDKHQQMNLGQTGQS